MKLPPQFPAKKNEQSMLFDKELVDRFKDANTPDAVNNYVEILETFVEELNAVYSNARNIRTRQFAHNFHTLVEQKGHILRYLKTGELPNPDIYGRSYFLSNLDVK